MALVLDTGPLYASLDRSDADHASCRRLIEEAAEPLVIPSPVLVEVDYWIHTRLHPGVLVALLDDIDQELIGLKISYSATTSVFASSATGTLTPT